MRTKRPLDQTHQSCLLHQLMMSRERSSVHDKLHLRPALADLRQDASELIYSSCRVNEGRSCCQQMPQQRCITVHSRHCRSSSGCLLPAAHARSSVQVNKTRWVVSTKRSKTLLQHLWVSFFSHIALLLMLSPYRMPFLTYSNLPPGVQRAC